MDVISKNLANANTTRTQSGDPYRRQVVVFQEANEKQSFKSIFDSKKNKDVENEITSAMEDVLWDLEDEYDISIENKDKIYQTIRGIGISFYAWKHPNY